MKVGPLDGVAVRAGDVVLLSIGPRDGDHSCDLTAIDLKIIERERRRPADVEPGRGCVGRRAGRQSARGSIWQRGRVALLRGARCRRCDGGRSIPADSVLAKWLAAKDSASERQALALERAETADEWTAGGKGQSRCGALSAIGRPCVGRLLGWPQDAASRKQAECHRIRDESDDRPRSCDVWPSSERPRRLMPPDLCVQAPSVIEIRLPADLAAGCELVADRRARQGNRRRRIRASSPSSPESRRSRPGCCAATNSVTAEAGASLVRDQAGCQLGADSRHRRQRGAAAGAGGVRRVSPIVPAGAVLHEDRAGRRSRLADACFTARTITWCG